MANWEVWVSPSKVQARRRSNVLTTMMAVPRFATGRRLPENTLSMCCVMEKTSPTLRSWRISLPPLGRPMCRRYGNGPQSIRQTLTTSIIQIKVTGPGILKDSAVIDSPNEFTIDCIDYKSDIKPEAFCYFSNGDSVPVTVTPVGNKQYKCVYKPVAAGNHKIFVNCDDQATPKTPYKVGIGLCKLYIFI